MEQPRTQTGTHRDAGMAADGFSSCATTLGPHFQNILDEKIKASYCLKSKVQSWCWSTDG